MARKTFKRRRKRKKSAVEHLRAWVRAVLEVAVAAALGYFGWSWLAEHPQHNPLAPLDLRDPIGWATARKLEAMVADPNECRATLSRSDVSFSSLSPTAGEGGESACARPDRTQLNAFPLRPDTPATTCAVAAAMELWRAQSVEPAARDIFGSELAGMEHMGVYNCRRMRGSGSNAWSEHATGNAIDISAFVLADGRRISVLRDWDEGGDKARFLRRIRDDACGVFATTLSPDFNAAHADHFHFDQAERWAGVCR